MLDRGATILLLTDVRTSDDIEDNESRGGGDDDGRGGGETEGDADDFGKAAVAAVTTEEGSDKKPKACGEGGKGDTGGNAIPPSPISILADCGGGGGGGERGGSSGEDG